eukprot:3635524-Amphidinium_carterae.1
MLRQHMLQTGHCKTIKTSKPETCRRHSVLRQKLGPNVRSVPGVVVSRAGRVEGFGACVSDVSKCCGPECA